MTANNPTPPLVGGKRIVMRIEIYPETGAVEVRVNPPDAVSVMALSRVMIGITADYLDQVLRAEQMLVGRKAADETKGGDDATEETK